MALILEWAAPAAAFLMVSLTVWGVYALVTSERALARERIGQYSGQASVFQPGRSSPFLKDRSFSPVGPLNRLLGWRNYGDRVALDLARAGVPLRVGEYLLIRWLVCCLLFALAYWFRVHLAFALALGLIGFFIPRFYVSRRESARVRKIEDQLVDALTMMANALRSGSSFLQAMELVARELPSPISQELGQVVAEVGVGATTEQALNELARRVRSYDVYIMVTAMNIQRSVGGNLSEVLDNIAHTIRERLRLLREVHVKSAEERFSAYILMVLPTFMLVAIAITNPRYMEPLLFEDGGRLMLVAALLMQIVGFLLMRRIADIRV